MTALSTEQFLLQLKASDVQVWLDGERVRVSMPKDLSDPGLRAQLSARKDEIAAFLKRLHGNGAAADAPLTARGDAGPVPLSFGQQRVWLLHELNKEQGSPYDTLTWLLSIRGALDVEALRRSLAGILRRHEVLRTHFHFGEAQPLQRIDGADEPAFEVADLRALPEDEIEAAVRQRAQAAKQTLFDLACGPLLRCCLLRLRETEYVLTIALHHIVFDAWSMDILTRELEQLYAAETGRAAAALPELPVQYGDFAVWQRRWLQGEVLSRHLDYWQRRLAGLVPVDLPLDRPRPALQTYAGARATRRIDAHTSAALAELARAGGATPFMLMLAALGVLLGRYSGQADVAIGTPVTNRDRPELQNLIGYFLNTLVMRLDVSGDITFAEALARARRTVLDGFAHQHLPFELLVDRLKVERDPSRNPLFQVMFVMHNALESVPLRLGDLDIAMIQTDDVATRLDLEFYVYQDADGFSVNCVYNTDLFEAHTAERMLRHYANLLGAVAVDPQRRLSALPLLDAQERRRMLVDWNATDRVHTAAATLPGLFARQAQRTPDTVAVDDGRRRLSYRELDALSDRLARQLRRRGVAAGARVGLCAERSAALVVGLLGILKAGAAYVPLDAAQPLERLSYILDDAAVRTLVTERHLRGLLPAAADVLLLEDASAPAAADDPPDVLHGTALHDALPDVPGDAPAYVIYTSGSTGRPKGVQVPHRAAVNFLCSMAHTPGAAAGDVLLAVTTVSFDIHVLEIFLPLTTGGTVLLADRDTAGDGRRLLALLRDSGATLMQATPSTWRMLIDAGWTERLPLKALCGGEPLPPELARQLIERCAELWNMYGPTETTVWSSVERIDAQTRDILIGRPIDNTRFHILDAHGEPVPVGVTGELYIGGAGVADGYLNRPELSAERFVPDPFAGRDGARLYRTGDLARYRADGRVQLLGRGDFQVKLRGFRIELGEIEALLLEHPQVNAAVVVLDANGGNPRLVAYAVPHAAVEASTRADAQTLREFLRGRLPHYMLPAVFVWLDALPLTGSGKIDRKALPAPQRAAPAPAAAAAPAAPRSELESHMARIWSELLDVEDIRSDDSFFDLGGHSLLSLKVVERFERATGRRIRPVDLVNQTLGQLVASLEARAAADTAAADTAAAAPAARTARLLQSVKNVFSRDT